MFASITILLNILILKAYNQNDKFEKSFKEINEKMSQNFIKSLINETSNLSLEIKNDSTPKPAEDNFKKEEKELNFEQKDPQNAEKPQLDNLKQKDNFYEPFQSLLRQPSVSPAYKYIRPRQLEEEQSQEYNNRLILRMNRIVQWQ